MTAQLAVGLAILLTAIGLGVMLYRAGGKGNEATTLKKEADGDEIFEKRGEDWDYAGGLLGHANIRMRKPPRDPK